MPKFSNFEHTLMGNIVFKIFALKCVFEIVSGVAKEGDGGGKIEVIAKKLGRKKYFEGIKIFGEGYSRAVNVRKIERTKKRSSKNFGV